MVRRPDGRPELPPADSWAKAAHDPDETRYGVAVDVNRAANLYAQGRTLRQIGDELGVHWSTVSQQLQSAGIMMRSGDPSAHPASTDQILELRDKT